jgi:hypothetical protein
MNSVHALTQCFFKIHLNIILPSTSTLWSLLFRWVPSRLLRRVVWNKFTDVSEVLAASIIRVMMEAAVNFYHTTRRNNAEDSRLLRTWNLSSIQVLPLKLCKHFWSFPCVLLVPVMQSSFIAAIWLRHRSEVCLVSCCLLVCTRRLLTGRGEVRCVLQCLQAIRRLVIAMELTSLHAASVSRMPPVYTQCSQQKSTTNFTNLHHGCHSRNCFVP